MIDTPGEYIQSKELGSALSVYSYGADVVGVLISSDEPYSLYSTCITCMCNREVIGIITKINHTNGNVKRVENWLKLAGCKKIFKVDSPTW